MKRLLQVIWDAIFGIVSATSKFTKIIAAIFLIGGIFLAYLTVQSVLAPIEFKKEQEKRYDEVVQNLKDIRKIQLAFNEVNGRFTGSFDTLVHFAKNESLPIIYKEGEIPEEMLGKITEREAIKKGLIIRDTLKINVLDSLFVKGYPIDSIEYIPYSQNKKFTMGQSSIKTGSGLIVQVFEAKAPSKYILHDLDKQMVINLNDGLEYKGLKVGSLTEPNNSAGNWE